LQSPVNLQTLNEHCLVRSVSRRKATVFVDQTTVLDVSFPSKIPSVVVGDFVRIDRQTQSIVSVEQRKNILSRSYFGKTKELASNLDHLFIVSSGGALYTEDFIDRTIASCLFEGIPFSLLINKSDIPWEQKERLQCYQNLDIDILHTSTKVDDGLSSLHKFLEARFSDQSLLESNHPPIIAFCGVSGVGKSSLINHFVPGARQKTGDVSHTGQGQQTTTMAIAHRAPMFNGKEVIIIDLPGLQKFGVTHISSQSLQNCFPEIPPIAAHCRFIDCSHTKEPECAVIKAFEEGIIFSSRYKSYLRMRDEVLKYEQS
jgi:ribosome biogenesis GTPase